MPEKDTLHRFLIEDTAVRGEWVHLDATFRALRANADYPPPVLRLLGQALAATALLTATLKFEGSLTLQISGGHPVTLLVMQARANGSLRGLAHWDSEAELPEQGDLFGPDAQLVMTLDPGQGRERYQGIVPLESGDLAKALEGYFRQSEQLPTRLWLACDGQAAAGLLLQEMPRREDSAAPRDEDAWRRLEALTDTLDERELLDLPVETLLRRLYHEEGVRLLEAEPVRFQCDCSAERVEAMIRGLGAEEARDIVRREGGIEVHCEFCNARYHYDAIDVDTLFREPASVTHPKGEH